MNISESIIKFRINNCQKKLQHYKDKYAHVKDNIVKNRKIKIFGFKRLRYCNNKMNYTLPFAFYEPKKQEGKKLPLIIYLHGSANGGESNIVPFIGGFPFVFRLLKNIKKNPCYILIPSIPLIESYITLCDNKPSSCNDTKFDGIFTSLFEKLKEKYPIDENRVYIVGSSDGAMGTYTQLELHKERYAAAIPMMGSILSNDKCFYKNAKDIPIWAVHAENDKNVPIKSYTFLRDWDGTDVIVDRLKEKGNKNVQYTRYEKFGHSASFIFMLKENWIEWIFKQSKDNK